MTGPVLNRSRARQSKLRPAPQYHAAGTERGDHETVPGFQKKPVELNHRIRSMLPEKFPGPARIVPDFFRPEIQKKLPGTLMPEYFPGPVSSGAIKKILQ